MRISIAMCTYNGARHLRSQLESIASQTYPAYELIVCDDGSTDGTWALIESFAGRVTFPVRLFKNERNLGSTRNFEKAIGLCGGDLIALADQDDEWYPDKLERMRRLFEELPEALAAFSDADIIDDDSVLVGRKLWKTISFSPIKKTPHVGNQVLCSLLRLNYIATGATMVFREGLRSELMPIPEPWVHDAWISWIAAVRGGLAPLGGATIRYRVHERQQIGVPPAALGDQLQAAKKNVAFFRLFARRLRALQPYLERHKDDQQVAKSIAEVEAKARFMEDRASLTGSVFHRIGWILRSWRKYRRFARGPISMVSDAFIVSGENVGKDKKRSEAIR